METHLSSKTRRFDNEARGSNVTQFTRVAYGLGGAGFTMAASTITMFVLLYYNMVLGVSAGLVGSVLALALIFDAISDPIVGYASDKFRSRWGRRHPFMYFAILPVSLLVYMLWNPPTELLDSHGLFIYLACIVIPLRTLVTFFEVPSTALMPEITTDYDERTRLANYRLSASWAAVSLMAILLYGYWLRDTPEHPNGLLNASGYAQMGTATAIAVFATMLISSVGLHSLIPGLQQPPARHAWSISGTLRSLRDTFTEPNLLPLLFANIMTQTAFNAFSSLQIYSYSYVWALSTAQISIAGGIWGVGVIIGFLATPIVSRGRDKRNVAMSMLALLALDEIVPLTLRLLDLFPAPESIVYFPLILTYATIQMAAYIVLAAIMASMLADVAERRELVSGERQEGTIYATQSLVGKGSSAIGVWIASLTLELISFPTGKSPAEVPVETVNNLILSFIVIFLIFYPVALMSFSRYRITRAEHTTDLGKLERRTASQSSPAETRPVD